MTTVVFLTDFDANLLEFKYEFKKFRNVFYHPKLGQAVGKADIAPTSEVLSPHGTVEAAWAKLDKDDSGRTTFAESHVAVWLTRVHGKKRSQGSARDP